MGKVMGMGEKMPELEVLRDKAIGAPPPRTPPHLPPGQDCTQHVG